MSTARLSRPDLLLSPTARRGLLGLALFVGGAAACYGALTLTGTGLSSQPGPAVAGHHDPKAAAPSADDPTTVRLPQSRWAAAGVQIRPAESAPLVERVWRTGKVALNADRVAHVSPLVEGVVREVPVRLGQDVKAGEVLAILDSKEVGQARLDLVKSRLALTFATANAERARTIRTNADALLAALAENVPIAEIDRRFRGRDLGEWRQQLITACSRWLHTRTRFESLRDLRKTGAISEENFRQARADHEAAEATYQALREEIAFQNRQQARAAEQKLREAQTAVTLSLTHLLMMGFSRAEVEATDLATDGQNVSLYPIRAPFAGTVVKKHATLSERVGPQGQVFEIVDLGTVWIEADVPEGDIPLLHGLAGQKLPFRAAGGKTPLAAAEVFYTGDLMDKATRTVTLRAAVANPGRRLKPGMFVEVQLARSPGAPVVQVPASAVQRHDNQAFVFVHHGGDEFRRANVTLGRESGGAIAVTAGLRAGERVAVEGGFALKSEMLRSLMSGD